MAAHKSERGAHSCSTILPSKSPEGPSPDAKSRERESLVQGKERCGLVSPRQPVVGSYLVQRKPSGFRVGSHCVIAGHSIPSQRGFISTHAPLFERAWSSPGCRVSHLSSLIGQDTHGTLHPRVAATSQWAVGRGQPHQQAPERGAWGDAGGRLGCQHSLAGSVNPLRGCANTGGAAVWGGEEGPVEMTVGLSCLSMSWVQGELRGASDICTINPTKMPSQLENPP